MTYCLKISHYIPDSLYFTDSKEEGKEEAATNQGHETKAEEKRCMKIEADIPPAGEYLIKSSPRTAAKFKEDLASGRAVIHIKKAMPKQFEDTIFPLDDGEINAFFAREEATYKIEKEKQIARITLKPDLVHSSSTALKRIQEMLSIAEKNKSEVPIYKLEDLLSLLTNRELEEIEFGPVLYKELKRETEEVANCDVIRGLKTLEDYHEKLLKALKQIEQDLWRTTMVLTALNGEPMLLSLSEHGAKTWQEILYPEESFPDLKYGHLDAARDIGFPDLDLPKPQMAAYVVKILDHYLSSEGLLATLGRLIVCNQFQQKLPLRVNAQSALPELLSEVSQPKVDASSSEEEKQQDLQRRYHMYCLAHWYTGWNLPLAVEKGSDLDVAGFADYANQQEHQDVGFKKSIVLHGVVA